MSADTKKKKDKRVTLTAKLRPGRDDDLIEWWDGLDRGTYIQESGRNLMIKALLRYGLGLPDPEPRQDEIAEIRGEINALRSAVAQVPTLLRQIKPTNGSSDLQSAIEKIAHEVERLAARVDSLTNGVPIEDTRLEDTPRATADDIAERKKNMKKASW